MSKYDELFDAYARSKAAQMKMWRALDRAAGAVAVRLGQLFEGPLGKYWCVDPEDPDAICSFAHPVITSDDDEVNYRVQLRMILEREGQRGKMQFDLFMLIDQEAARRSEFIFSAPNNSKTFKINPDNEAEIDAFCQHVFDGMLAHLEGRDDWATSGNAGMGFHTIVLDRDRENSSGPGQTD